VHTQSSAEYWTRSGSLVHTDPKGQHDAEIPDNVRIFAFGGTQHGPAGFPPSRGNGKNLANPGDYRPLLRALLLSLDGWTRGGPPCPESICPTIRDGTLVDWHQVSTGFPDIPDAGYPMIIQQPPVLDFGPRWRSDGIVDRQPPAVLATYRTLVPRVDADGNELGCLLPPEVAVPVATYTGWNLRSAAAGAEDQLVSLGGSYIPFCRTRAEREQRQDPRISVEERYAGLDNYLQKLSAVCRDMEAGGLLLPEDGERIIARQKERIGELFP
jgi:hypothetical protein